MRSFFVTRVIFAAALLSASLAQALEPSLVLECNEEASVMGFTGSRSNFGGDYSTHPGWRSESENGKYRVWTVPAGLSIRSFEWSCQIDGKQAILKIWHEATPKDELIDKYGIAHERCGAFRKMSLTLDGKAIFQNLQMESDGCDERSSRKFALYFGKTRLLPRELKEGLALEIKAVKERNAEPVFFISPDLSSWFYLLRREKRSLIQRRLPLTELDFNNVIFAK